MEANTTIRLLSGLLHYHERMLAGTVVCRRDDQTTSRECPVNKICDPYAEALKEAIACIRKCYGLD